jgi:3-hydroxybutyryl-CoA dehydrogenase
MAVNKASKVGIIGAGTMGSGIAQIAAQAGHETILFDLDSAALNRSKSNLSRIMTRLVEKGRISQDDSTAIQQRVTYAKELTAFKDCALVIEAIVERLNVKQQVFGELEDLVADDCILATNTSSLSVTAIAGGLKRPANVIGLHFFNPAPLLPLVEVVPGLATDPTIVETCYTLMGDWGKMPVKAKDTPGFIVNRVARPFYGEAIRIFEEGIADFATIDHAMRSVGGFRMGPFELMDLIGNDVNYVVTETVFEEFFYDPRYRPSFTQKRMVQAGWYGRKSGKGYYDHSEDAEQPVPDTDPALHQVIVDRIVVMLINEAADALNLNIASKEDIDLAMTKGVNYPKGLLKWADEKGIETCLRMLEDLQARYGEDRYRPSPLLRSLAERNQTIY